MSNSKTKQLELLKKEIDWWEESLNIKPINLDIYYQLLSLKNSFLCKEYNTENMKEHNCEGCPIYKYTELQYCEGTLYYDIDEQLDVLINVRLQFEKDITKRQLQIILKEVKFEEDKLYKIANSYLTFLKDEVLPFIKREI